MFKNFNENFQKKILSAKFKIFALQQQKFCQLSSSSNVRPIQNCMAIRKVPFLFFICEASHPTMTKKWILVFNFDSFGNGRLLKIDQKIHDFFIFWSFFLNFIKFEPLNIFGCLFFCFFRIPHTILA